jgi:hypothetical protein
MNGRLALLVLSLTFASLGPLKSQEKGQLKQNVRNNMVKVDLVPVIPLINGHNQKWVGLEYERLFHKKFSFDVSLDGGLFKDYTFIKYYNFFNEEMGFYHEDQNVTTRGYHFMPSFRFYFLQIKNTRGKGLYLGGILDYSQYFEKSSEYSSLTGITQNSKNTTSRLSLGLALGLQYTAWSRLVVDLNINFIAALFSGNKGDRTSALDPLIATWTYYNKVAWSSINFSMGYQFGKGKRK